MATPNGSKGHQKGGQSDRRKRNIKLIELRLNAGMASSDLAYRSGTSRKHMQLIEGGWIPGPRIQFAIAQVFDLSPLDIWPLESQIRASELRSARARKLREQRVAA